MSEADWEATGWGSAPSNPEGTDPEQEDDDINHDQATQQTREPASLNIQDNLGRVATRLGRNRSWD